MQTMLVSDMPAAAMNGAPRLTVASTPEIAGPNMKPMPNAMPMMPNDFARSCGAV